MTHPERIRSIHPSTPPAGDAATLAAAAAAAVERMAAEGRSGRVTVSMSVEVEQTPEVEVAGRQREARDWSDRRMAFVLAAAAGIMGGLLVASSFLPDLAGVVAGVVAAFWVFDKVSP